MPIYEYRCAGCGEEFEKIVFNGREKIECPRCGASEPEKKFSGFAVVGSPVRSAKTEAGPCPCGAPRRGMCQS